MANTFLTPSIIAREALMKLENNLVFANLVHRDHSREWNTGLKVGNAVTIRGPATFTANEFTSTISVQAATETSVTLTLEKHFDVSFDVTSSDWKLNLQDFSDQLIEPAVIALAQAIDNYVAQQFDEVYNFVGTATDPPDSLDDIAAIDEKMNNEKVPFRGRNVVVNAKAKRDLFSIPQFTDAEKRADDGSALREASMGRFMGFDWFMDQNIQSFTGGTLSDGTSKAAITDGVQTIGLKTIDIDETTLTGTLVTGDVFTVAGDTQQYVVTGGPHTASGNAITGLTFEPAAKVAWGDGAAVTFVANHVANLAFHRNAIALVVAPLEMPDGAAKSMVMGNRGLGIRYVSDYSISSKTDTISLDVLVGSRAIDPRLATRVLG